MNKVDLSSFKPSLERGRPKIVEALWIIALDLFVASSIPGSWHRRWILKVFGAEIGKGVVLKSRIRIKFPWKLEIGNNSWIGEGAWIDNLADVTVADNCCISQGVYLCTGNHNWSIPSFDLTAEPIRLEEGAWVAANATIGPGVTIGENAVVGLGATASSDVPASRILSANGALLQRERVIDAP